MSLVFILVMRVGAENDVLPGNTCMCSFGPTLALLPQDHVYSGSPDNPP